MEAMESVSNWQEVLAGATPGQHIAQLYTDPGFLARAVAEFAGEGLRHGDGLLIIAIPAHRVAIADRLGRQGFDIEELERRGQVAVLDAADCLARLVLDGLPDPERLRVVVGHAFEAIVGAGYRPVRAFGEMVDILRRTDLGAALRLEELWNAFLATHELSLLCGYSVDSFDPRSYRGVVQGVCAMHSDLIPVEDYAALARAVERA